MQGWNIADVLETVAETVPDRPAIIRGQSVVTWRDLITRGRGLASYLTRQGVSRQGKVALYLHNRPEYLEGFVGALLGSLVPVNTNYRYTADELVYLWNNCDAEAVVFQGVFTEVVADVRNQVRGVRAWLWVDDGVGTCPPWATPYSTASEDTTGSAVALWQRSGNDLVLLYTGGTTGMPKGVMWRQDDLFTILTKATSGRYPEGPDLDVVRARVAAQPRLHLPAAPLMHGTGSFTCLPFLFRGGAIVLLEGDSFSATELLDAVREHNVHSVAWVGDVFARPVVEALERPDAPILDSWRVVTSGGLTFSEDLKRRLLAQVPGLAIADVFGASETLAVGRSVTRSEEEVTTNGTFAFESAVRVFRMDSTEDVAADGMEIGRVAFAGRHPIGYYKDEQKTKDTFVHVEGVSYCLSGDLARRNSDGGVTMLGRGSTSINTGGEKVFPEEVESVVRELSDIVDVAVAGIPDEKWGETVAAAVQLLSPTTLTPETIQDFVRERLAAYKIPRHIVFVAEVPRLPSGKPDYVRLAGVLERPTVCVTSLTQTGLE